MAATGEATPGLVQVYRHEGGGVWVWVDDVPGVMGRGRTAIEAFADWQQFSKAVES